MGARSKIPWTGSTWNFGRGCRRRDAGCVNCYAERQAIRLAGPGQPFEGLVRSTPNGPRWTGEVAFDADALLDPIRWTEPRFVFVDSMSDLFYEPFADEQIAAGIGAMMLAPLHVYQVLTKREERAVEFFRTHNPAACLLAARRHGVTLTRRQAARIEGLLPSGHPLRVLFRPNGFAEDVAHYPSAELLVEMTSIHWPLPHLWLGASCNDHASFITRAPTVAKLTAGAVRFLSLEPLTGAIDVRVLAPLFGPAAISWLVTGGESGPGARPCVVDWIRDVVLARDLGFAPFVKQLGAKAIVDLQPAAHTRDDWRSDPETGARQFRMVGTRLPLLDRKGEDMAEWPDDLLVRDYPPNVYLPTPME